MISPNVTELPRRLEPISGDTFIERGHGPAIGPPPSNGPRALAHNVTKLRLASAGVRDVALTAA